MSADFLRDINASNMGEAMQYTVGAEFDQEANDDQHDPGGNQQSAHAEYLEFHPSKEVANLERGSLRSI